jgi:hypothetical protein
MILSQNYAGNKKSYNIVRMKMCATVDTAKPNTGNKKRLKIGSGQTYNRSRD